MIENNTDVATVRRYRGRREPSSSLVEDERAAATELGYVFTFMLGVLLLTMFSMWAWEIETATRERWNEHALEDNVERITAAIERADASSRTIENASYAEPVHLTPFEASQDSFILMLTDEELRLHDVQDIHSMSAQISAAGNSTHTGEIRLSGVDTVWVIHNEGVTSITTEHPGW